MRDSDTNHRGQRGCVDATSHNEDVALEASFANGGQLAYSYIGPLAAPEILRKLPMWLLNKESPIRFAPRWDSLQWRWIASFLGACRTGKVREVTAQLASLGAYSRELLSHLMAAPVRPEDIELLPYFPPERDQIRLAS